MSRRDTIIIAVLVNTGLLAILFMMAFHVESERPTPPSAEPARASETRSRVEITPLDPPQESLVAGTEEVVDEVDQAIQQYAAPTESSEDFIEITVKRGDFLEKIAHANGTTIAAIKELNGLTSDRLNIGQVLKLPKSSSQQEIASSNAATDTEEEWYTVQQGDNPWTISRKFSVRFDRLLDLNDLDETSARSLKPGDRLRVR